MTNKYYTKYIFEKLCSVFEELYLVDASDWRNYWGVDIIGVTSSGKRYAIKCEYTIDTELDKNILPRLDEAKLRYKCVGALLVTNIELDEKFLERAKKLKISVKHHVVMPPELSLKAAEEVHDEKPEKEIIREVKPEKSLGASVLRVILGIILFLIGMYLLFTALAGTPTAKYEGEIIIKGIQGIR